jgi:C4-dicarboxylate-specific signal transduction histidine kinase
LAAPGWGLAISVSLLGAGGGRLSLDRSIESGSRFRVVLPFAHAAT